MSSSINHDPWGCRKKLAAALSDTALKVFEVRAEADDDASRAAFDVAVELGRCRAFGVDPGEVDGVLPESVAIAASCHMRSRIEEWRTSFEQLAKWDDAADGPLPDDLIVEEHVPDMIDALMMTHAAFLAITESLEDLEEQGEWPEKFYAETNRLDAAIQELDSIVDDCIHQLARVSQSQFVRNYRVMLAGADNEFSPWWLSEMEALEDLVVSDAVSTTVNPVQAMVARDERRQKSPTARRRAIQSFASVSATSGLPSSADGPKARSWLERWKAPAEVGDYSASLSSAEVREGFVAVRFFLKGKRTDDLAGRSIQLSGTDVGEIGENGQLEIATLEMCRVLELAGEAKIELNVSGQQWSSR